MIRVVDEGLEERIESLLAAGDSRTAVTVAVRGYGPQILTYLHAVLRSADDGNEAFSRFCEDLWTGIGTYTRKTTFKAWAYTVAWHAALRVVQDPQRRRRTPLGEDQVNRLVEEVRSLTAPHLLTANKAHLTEMRASLEPSEQTLLILRLDRGLSWREIVEVLDDGSTEASLRKRFERIKEHLRALATERGLLPK
jgi:RNA polymerase sigma-70 factor (ECF subfamily)